MLQIKPSSSNPAATDLLVRAHPLPHGRNPQTPPRLSTRATSTGRPRPLKILNPLPPLPCAQKRLGVPTPSKPQRGFPAEKAQRRLVRQVNGIPQLHLRTVCSRVLTGVLRSRLVHSRLGMVKRKTRDVRVRKESKGWRRFMRISKMRSWLSGSLARVWRRNRARWVSPIPSRNGRKRIRSHHISSRTRMNWRMCQ